MQPSETLHQAQGELGWGNCPVWSVRDVAVLASCLLPALKDRPEHLALSKGALCGAQSRIEGGSTRLARLPAPDGPGPLLQGRLVPRPVAEHDVDHIQAISVEGKQYIPLSEVGWRAQGRGSPAEGKEC